MISRSWSSRKVRIRPGVLPVTGAVDAINALLLGFSRGYFFFSLKRTHQHGPEPPFSLTQGWTAWFDTSPQRIQAPFGESLCALRSWKHSPHLSVGTFLRFFGSFLAAASFLTSAAGTALALDFWRASRLLPSLHTSRVLTGMPRPGSIFAILAALNLYSSPYFLMI